MSACRYCGLEMGAQRLPNHEARYPRNPDVFARHDPSVLRCEPVRIAVRQWHPQEKRYVDVAVQEAWRVR